MTAPAARRYGFSLIELVCVISLLAVLGAIVTVMLRETLAVERLQAEGFDEKLQQNALADQFRADVARAEASPQKWNEFDAGKHTLILRMKAGEYLVYLWRDGKLRRRVYEDKKLAERILPVGGDRVGVEFVGAGADAKLVRLRMPTVSEGKPRPGETLEIAAALGGDWR